MAHRFSHAISEGDGISVIVAVDDPSAAEAAESQRAEALVVERDPASIREATGLPILWRGDVSLEQAATLADAYLLVFESLDDDDGRFEELHSRAVELGLDCVVDIRSEEELEEALERADPEIFLLSPRDPEGDDTPIERVLDLLASVPAGKLAIADLPLTTPSEIRELERAGMDAVIVRAQNITELVGGPPPSV
jgi:indole-3-glycerol phosphate synthase